MCGKIVPNWMWEYTMYCVNYLLILIQFILVITVITAINARMANTFFPDGVTKYDKVWSGFLITDPLTLLNMLAPESLHMMCHPLLHCHLHL